MHLCLSTHFLPFTPAPANATNVLIPVVPRLPCPPLALSSSESRFPACSSPYRTELRAQLNAVPSSVFPHHEQGAAGHGWYLLRGKRKKQKRQETYMGKKKKKSKLFLFTFTFSLPFVSFILSFIPFTARTVSQSYIVAIAADNLPPIDSRGSK